MALFLGLAYLHMVTVGVSIFLFVLRFFWLCRQSAMLQQRWIKILPHINDTLLLVSGVGLVVVNRIYPFTAGQSWLTEKLFGVIIYILLGAVALGKRPRSGTIRWLAFILALVCFYLVMQISLTKLPLLME
ncbi:SirB2 family protein [Brenneria goodwinii]|uniref:FIG002082: Protein sirB2 n=2 Tax=Brenneria goodwinii TaxID=1109412 RepID=A0A0G4K0L3_9GAMM|nr:SirB2 family protein [Brenneria goodwinii]MCG8156631.1 SirB2 family protein [Brenneria goodwinii]MCG8159699.1 SirB2 family protein [Brenneria goodwinii]MCG8165789.1 SirB2 family protein [Brenneria goodwinii]MCG8170250.1 SirB2 family protein [Brenneria goodwinii]MCG8173558.1 SirB2 family protein [Brenneria goodwinii]